MKKYLSTRVWILIIALILAAIAIAPNPWASGIEVKSVTPGSDVANNGLAAGQILKSINGQEILTRQDVTDALASLQYTEQEITIETSEETISYTVTNDLGFTVDDNLTISANVVDLTEGSTLLSINDEEIDDVTSFNVMYEKLIPSQIIKIETDAVSLAYVSREVPDFTVTEARTSNLVFGLEFTGGTRVLLKPVTENGSEVSDAQIQTLIDVLSNRLNVYGLSDIKIRSAEDWDGNKYVLVELAGVTEQEVKELIAQQGKFEAKIGDAVVFEGGEEDIPYVCRNDGSCSGIRSCSPVEGGYACTFEFAVTLSQDAANDQAAATSNLAVVPGEGGKRYLNETIDLYLDGELVDSLQIAEDLKGEPTTQIAISGPGYGASEDEAFNDAVASMNQLQTILITGSLPFDLEIAKIDTISPVFGTNFLTNALLVGLVAIVAVAIVLFIRYRKLKLVGPILLTGLSEVFLILGFAAFVGWNLDLVSIAGIIAAIGTGVDDQIVIIDESLRGKNVSESWKDRLKRAFFIIFAAYAATVAAMVPLWNAGGGLMRGFALTTIIGVTIGVFLTRPAFASIVEKMFKE